ncbi:MULTISPECIES: hypothetical protein [Enterococcus]|uniref:hypothetical protein n=1 Tax=Enterococcus TaxID=1350 RepID=UPI002019A270|nr:MULTISPECIES: hypothetical protein [Enterococcus]UQQ90499.1 hypothetical protein LQ059_13365 [Enterococcus faecium]
MSLEYPKPSHKVVETEKAVYIDGFKLDFVIEDSVKIEELSPEQVIVNLSFVAASYEKQSTEN